LEFLGIFVFGFFGIFWILYYNFFREFVIYELLFYFILFYFILFYFILFLGIVYLRISIIRKLLKKNYGILRHFWTFCSRFNPVQCVAKGSIFGSKKDKYKTLYHLINLASRGP
jgi:hypothetical protein